LRDEPQPPADGGLPVAAFQPTVAPQPTPSFAPAATVEVPAPPPPPLPAQEGELRINPASPDLPAGSTITPVPPMPGGSADSNNVYVPQVLNPTVPATAGVGAPPPVPPPMMPPGGPAPGQDGIAL
jgi:hypothetical protein